VSTVWTLLSWSIIRELLPFDDIDKINYYLTKCYNQNLSVRKLQGLLKSQEYERLPLSTKAKLITKEQLTLKDTIPNPIIIDNPNNIEIYNEKLLQNLILENISSFMKQLGTGYSFIDREYPIKIGNRNYSIDYLLFNIEFNCYVVVELKVTELKKEYIGQILLYMNYIDNDLKKDNHNNTIGILIVKQDNKYIMKYFKDNTNIITREYKVN